MGAHSALTSSTVGRRVAALFGEGLLEFAFHVSSSFRQRAARPPGACAVYFEPDFAAALREAGFFGFGAGLLGVKRK